MKTLFLFLLTCLASTLGHAQTGDSTETFEPTPFQLHFASFEAPSVSGTLALPLTLQAQANATVTGYQGVSDNKGFFSYDDEQMRAVGGGSGPVATQTVTLNLEYNPSASTSG